MRRLVQNLDGLPHGAFSRITRLLASLKQKTRRVAGSGATRRVVVFRLNPSQGREVQPSDPDAKITGERASLIPRWRRRIESADLPVVESLSR